MVKEVPLAPHLVDIDNLDLGDLCPKFDVMGAGALDDMVPPRKPSNLAIAQTNNESQLPLASADVNGIDVADATPDVDTLAKPFKTTPESTDVPVNAPQTAKVESETQVQPA